MRKFGHFIQVLIVFLLSTGILHAADLNEGFFDLKWGTNLSNLAGFTKISQNLNVSFYASPKRAYKIADLIIPHVVYGSYAGKFFAVYVNIETIDVFTQLKRHINQKYGLPQKTLSMKSQQTTYRWKYKDTKIKLKLYENRDNMKLAFCYTPVSQKVNEAQQEAFQENAKKPRFPLDEFRMQEAIDLIDLLEF